MKVAVVGAGVSGLACAWRLLKAGVDVTVLERGTIPGGVMQSYETQGFQFERGPNTLQSSATHVSALIDELELRDRLVTSRPEAKRRFVWRHNRLHVLPEGPKAFLKSDLLSWRGKLRALGEPLVKPPRHPSDETMAQFFGRRLGTEVVRAFLDPFCAGVFTGLPENLGLDAFPSMMGVEREYGGLMKAMKAKRKAGGERVGGADLWTFDDGLAVLPMAISEALGDRLELGIEVVKLKRDDGDGQQRVTLVTHADGSERTRHFDHVVLATSAHVAGDLLRPHQPRVANHLQAPRLETPALAAVALGFRREHVEHPLNGFGALCASDSPLRQSGPILGILFPSSIFPGRVPEGHVSLRVMIGGARDDGASTLSDQGLVGRAVDAVREILGVRGEPVVAEPSRWPQAIPQYAPGHLRRVAEVKDLVREVGAVTLAGNYLVGVGIESCVASGMDAASAVSQAA